MSDAEAGTAARRARQEAQRAAARAPSGGGGARSASGAGSGGGSSTSATAVAPTRRELDPDRLVALEEERDFLLRSLDDLEREHDAGDVDDADYAALKDDYTARAATVLRSIENRQEAADSLRWSGRRGRPLLVGAVVVILAIGLGIFVAQSSGRRTANQGVSGDIRQSIRDQLLDAETLMAEQKLSDAIVVYDRVLAVSPDNVQALAYKGWLLRLTSLRSANAEERASLTAASLALLDTAVKTDPSFPDAHIFRAVLLRDLGRPQEALAELDQLAPDDIPVNMTEQVQRVRDDLEASVAAGTTVPATVP